jgi:GTPase SAR1 family protein
MINNKNKQNEIFKILFVGLDGSGKSTIITQLRNLKVKFNLIEIQILKNEEVVEIFPTPFVNVVNLNYESKSISLVEVSGQMR